MNAADMLTCRELVELITDYLEGAMPAEARARFESHIDACKGCHGYLDQIRQAIRLTGKLRDESLDPTMRERLLAAFRDWKAAGAS